MKIACSIKCYYVLKCESGRYKGMYVDGVGYGNLDDGYSHIYEIEYAQPYQHNTYKRALKNVIKKTHEQYKAIRIDIEKNKWEKWNWKGYFEKWKNQKENDIE